MVIIIITKPARYINVFTVSRTAKHGALSFRVSNRYCIYRIETVQSLDFGTGRTNSLYAFKTVRKTSYGQKDGLRNNNNYYYYVRCTRAEYVCVCSFAIRPNDSEQYTNNNTLENMFIVGSRLYHRPELFRLFIPLCTRGLAYI